MADSQQTNSTSTQNYDVNSLGQRVIQIKADLMSARKKLDVQVQVNQNLRGDLEYLTNNAVLKSTYNEVLEQNQAIAQNNVELIKQNELLSKQSEEQHQVAATLQAENGRISSENSILQRDNGELKKELENHEEAAKDQQQQLQAAHDKMNSLVVEKDELSMKCKSLCDLNQELLKKVQNSEELYRHITEERKNLEIFNFNISERKDCLESENQKLLEKGKKLEEENSALRKENQQLNSKNQEETRKLYEKLRVKSSQLRISGENLRELGKEHKNLKRLIASEKVNFRQELRSESKGSTTKEKNYELSKQVESLQRQLAESEKQSSTVEDMRKKEQRTNAAVQLLRVQVDSLIKERDDLNRQLETHRQGSTKIDAPELEATIKIMAEKGKESDAKVKELMDHLNTQTDYIKHLESQLDSRELEISNLQRNSKLELYHREILQKKEEENAAANKNIKELNESLGKCENYNAEARIIIERLLRERTSLQAQLQDLKSQNLPEKEAELNRSLETQSVNLKLANDAIDSLRSEICSFEKKLEEKVEEIQEQKERLEAKEIDFTYVSMELTALQSENKRLQTATHKRHSGEGVDELSDETPNKRARMLESGKESGQSVITID